MIQFPKQLKFYRKERGLSQDDLAQQVHMTRQAVSKWESGSASPDLNSLVKLSAIFNVSLDNLVLGQSLTPNRKIDSSKFVYDPIKNQYVRNVKTMNIYEFICHYWWIIAIFLILCAGIVNSLKG